jgi:ATP-dependent helicase YprA (DUF1998 family)
MSDSEYESDAAEELEGNGEVLEFGFQDEQKELGGRRLKAHKEHKKKMRPGTFGEPRAAAPCSACGGRPPPGTRHQAPAGPASCPQPALQTPGRTTPAPGQPCPPPAAAETMGLSVGLLRAIKRKGYRLPTPIQRKAMPLILQGLDVIGMARTGSGKTAAFVLPMVEK